MSTRSKVGPIASAGQAPVTRRRTPREYVYLACAKSMYGTDRLRCVERCLRTRFPKAVLLLPDRLYRSREEWLARFPDVLETLTRLVFLTDLEGFIGRGVAGECRAALAAGKPVELLSPRDELISHTRLQLSRPNEADWIRYRRVTIRPAAE